MGCPARMADTDRAHHGLAAEQSCQIAQFAFAAANRHLALVENRNAGRIVTPVLELSKTFQNQWRRFATADISDNTAHLFLGSFHFDALLHGPAFAMSLLSVVKDQSSVRNVMTNRGRSGDIDVITQRDRCDQGRIATDLNAVADFAGILLKSIIVAGDRASADIAITAYGHITEISKMIGLGAIADLGFFSFHEIADVNISAQFSAGPQMSKRANDRAASDSTAAQDDGKSQMNFVTQMCVSQICAAVNTASLPDHRGAAEMSVRADDRVFANGRALFNVGGRRVLQGDALRHPFAVC